MNRSFKLFFAGACAYPMLEIIWRGRTHPSMAVAGGISAVALDRIAQTSLALPLKGLAGAAAITGIEWSFGRLFNQHHKIWDYRRMPFNYQGQICLPYSMLWYLLSLGMVTILKKQK